MGFPRLQAREDVKLNATILAPYVTVTNGVAWFAIGWVSIVSYGLLYASHEQHKREQEEQEVRNVRKRCSHIDSTGARCRIPCAVPEFHNGEVRCSAHEFDSIGDSDDD